MRSDLGGGPNEMFHVKRASVRIVGSVGKFCHFLSQRTAVADLIVFDLAHAISQVVDVSASPVTCANVPVDTRSAF
jgi:hypothetical protein